MMRIITLTLILLIFCKLRIFATHIVGGEFELVHTKDYNYELRLIQYFDHLHGHPGAEDYYLIAHIFRKKNNLLITSVNLNHRGSDYVAYTDPKCQTNSIALQTRKITYTTNIYLSPDIYKDPDGYYIVWERCCRNGIINNIREPENTGQTFYLEFPPVVKNDEPFINSSPILFPPLSDYAVVGQLYYVDFGGTDPDGDSLVYSLAVPLRGNSSPEMPIPGPLSAPYRGVSWSFGYNIENVIPGPRPLSINKAGMLTVVPDRPGLFVFSVKVEEYRNKEKIGEVRRDFQLLVVRLEIGKNPVIKAREKGAQVFYKEGDIIKFGVNDEKCFDLFINDPDPNEQLKVKALPVNFSGNLDGIFSPNQGITKDYEDTLKIEVCFQSCPYTVGTPFYIDFIVMDDACSLPLMDTVRVGIIIEEEANQRPFFTDPLRPLVNARVPIGEKLQLPVIAQDDDGDQLKLEVVPVGFRMEDYGMSLVEIMSDEGTLEAEFQFDPNCNVYDFSRRASFTLFFKLRDVTTCKVSLTDEFRLDLELVYPEENAPEISTDLHDTFILVSPETQVSFGVFGKDEDNDIIRLTGFGEGFSFEEYGMQFENKEGAGSLSSYFTWNTSCSNLQNREEFLLRFVVDDRGSCKKSHYDTLSVRIKIDVPKNEKPRVSIENLSDFEVNVAAGYALELKILGFDIDNDSILLTLENQQYRQLNYEFRSVTGVGSVQSVFKWVPDCSLLINSLEQPVYRFRFIVKDLRCFNSKADTITLTVHLEELAYNYSDFAPANIFTPNQDQVNDIYEIENLPPDNCENRFIGITIFNRWGKVVFTDNRRDFKWDGSGHGSGVYYYVIKYSKKEYKGTVSILY